jgi:hypothetical protein
VTERQTFIQLNAKKKKKQTAQTLLDDLAVLKRTDHQSLRCLGLDELAEIVSSVSNRVGRGEGELDLSVGTTGVHSRDSTRVLVV